MLLFLISDFDHRTFLSLDSLLSPSVLDTLACVAGARLEVVSTRKNERERRRHARGLSPRVSPSRAPFSPSPTTSKRLLRRL